jgi:hypothetical protein
LTRRATTDDVLERSGAAESPEPTKLGAATRCNSI